METGHQVVRSANEIWWRANDPDRAVEQDEMRIANFGATNQAEQLFCRLVVKLKKNDDLVGWKDS